MTLDKSKKTLLLIDSHALIHRAFHAFPPTLTTANGEPINAVYGFAGLLLDVLQKFTPTHVVAVFDSEGPTHRQAEYTQYKANRSETDVNLASQFPKVHQLVQLFNMPVVMATGIEADDLIGTIDEQYSGKWAQTVIVTGDRDLLQLVDDDTFVYLAGSSFSQSKLYDAEGVKEKMGVTPAQIADYKGLSGDASDNIPGVRGIGPKSACDLIAEYGSVEKIYENIENVNKKYKQKLIDSQEEAFLSKKLATIHKDIPISFDFTSAELKNFNVNKVKEFFEEMRFKSLMGRLEAFGKKYMEVNPENYSLFDEKNDVTSNVKDWDGKDIKESEVYLLADYMNLDQSPLHWDFTEIYFKVDDNEVVKVEASKFEDFWNKIKAKKIITYDKKKFLHVLLNKSIKFDSDNLKDIGITSVIFAEGRSTYSLKSIYNFFGFNFFDLTSSNLVNLNKLHEVLKTNLNEKKSFDKIIQLEESILSTIMKMERNGIILDVPMMQMFEQKLREALEKLKKEIFENVGHEFNINSPKQLSEVLFLEKRLPVTKKTKGGAFSTDEITLRKLLEVDPIIENLLAFREIDKLLSTYVSALPEYVDNDGRIHSVFDQFGAVSGRFASRNPNLQNIPLSASNGVDIRNTFKSADDSIFISFDYSQQELRILAALADEKVMVDSFNNNIDIHKITAAEIFEIDVEKVDAYQRGVGKTVNFSVIYGISSFGLSERMKIDRKTADMFIKKYFETYSNVQKYMDEAMRKARENNCSETMMGRKRVNEMINSNNRILKNAAERELFNFVIQGSAADIMKVAMSRFDDVLEKYPAKLLLQIHDEFLFEYKLEAPSTRLRTGSSLKPEVDDYTGLLALDFELQEFIKEIHSVMLNAYDIAVKYKVDVSIGDRWGSMVDVKA